MSKTTTLSIPKEFADKLKALSQSINTLGLQVEANQQYFQMLFNMMLAQLHVIPYDESRIEKKISFDLEKQTITVEENPKIITAANLDGVTKRN